MGSVEQIHGGWGSWTFLVHGDRILRFARTAEVAAAHHREAALLPELVDAVSFAVPRPEYFGSSNGRTCIGYRLIEGRPLTAADDWPALAGMLLELHDFPVERARLALGQAGTRLAWREYYRALWVEIERRVLPVVGDGARARLVARYAAFLAGGWDFRPVLVHRDLAPEHILVGADGKLVGLIDFEDAAIGDPAIDFAGLVPILGWDRVEQLIADYGRPVDRGRLRTYWWLVPVHELLHGLGTGDERIVAEALAVLRERLGG